MAKGGLAMLIPYFLPAMVGTMGYAAWRIDWRIFLHEFFTGPGRTKRVLVLLFCLFNTKNMPFVWTYRVVSAIYYHYFWRESPQLGPRALFKPMINTTHAPFMEIDYNLHKSNLTYFSDIDVSRTHLMSFLCRVGMRRVARNAETRLVLDPKTGQPVKGALNIILGAVECSFKREIPGYKSYEMWSRILSWDRKWLFIITHIVPKGTARPAEWLDPRQAGRIAARGPRDATGDWEKKIYATAISKYVCKVGRMTVPPALVLAESGLLPERPGGWMSGENQVGDESADLGEIDLLDHKAEWNWQRVEAERRRGAELSSKFHDLDDLHALFDGGNGGALATL